MRLVAFIQLGMRRHIADDSMRVTGGCEQTVRPSAVFRCNELTVYSVRLMAMPLKRQYGYLMVRGYKTAETKTTAHLKNMRG